jgi:hypothetical protein
MGSGSPADAGVARRAVNQGADDRLRFMVNSFE